jgi:hypothetical protein
MTVNMTAILDGNNNKPERKKYTMSDETRGPPRII